MERYRIEEGRELEGEMYEETLRDILRPRSKGYALHSLKDSGKTEEWTKEKLGKTGYPRGAVEYAVDFLEEYRFPDDNAHAQSYVRSYAGKESRRQMVYEMQRKGVDSSYIEEALDQSSVDEEESIRQALTRRLKGEQEASYQGEGCLAAFLRRKGYSFEVINRILRETETAEDQD